MQGWAKWIADIQLIDGLQAGGMASSFFLFHTNYYQVSKGGSNQQLHAAI